MVWIERELSARFPFQPRGSLYQTTGLSPPRYVVAWSAIRQSAPMLGKKHTAVFSVVAMHPIRYIARGHCRCNNIKGVSRAEDGQQAIVRHDAGDGDPPVHRPGAGQQDQERQN